MSLTKEGTCLFDRNTYNTGIKTKFCLETPTKAQPVPLSREQTTGHDKFCKKIVKITKHLSLLTPLLQMFYM